MSFWIIAALMIAASLGALLAPLLRRRGATVDTAEYDIEVYRDQIAELDRDSGRGLLSDEETEAARTEIARRMLAADARLKGSKKKGADRDSQATIVTVAIVAVLVPAGALAVYLRLGQPDVPGMPLAERTDIPARTAEIQSRAELIARLLERAEANPADAEAWRLLGAAYSQAQRFDDAVAALRKATGLGPPSPLLNSEYGEALFMAAEGAVTPESRMAFEAVLAARPDDPRANHYLAVGDYQAGKTRAALDRWAALIAATPADAPYLPVVREHLTRAAGDLGLEVASVMPEPLPPEQPRGPALTPEQQANVEAMTPEERQEMIRGMVEGLEARLQEDPEDMEGWLRLIRARAVMGDTDKAQAALDRAFEVFAEAPFPRQRLAALAGELDLEAPEAAGGGAPDIGDMVERLAARLEREPDDLEGWLMLARSYTVLERHAEARRAAARAAELAPDNPDILSLHARAIRAAAGEAQTPESIVIMRRVLALAPDSLEALWFVGIAEADAGNKQRATELLERAWSLIPEDSPDRAFLRQKIDELTGG